MGLPGKPRVDGELESGGKRWVIAGISLRAPLKPIYTNPGAVDNGDGTDNNEEFSTTPKSEEARIPAEMTCPAAPRKRKSSFKCNNNYRGVREFFNPPDLESVFIRNVETWKCLTDQ